MAGRYYLESANGSNPWKVTFLDHIRKTENGKSFIVRSTRYFYLLSGAIKAHDRGNRRLENAGLLWSDQ